MRLYVFEVVKDGESIMAKHSVALPDLTAAWSRIANLARIFDEPGCKIRVKDEAGEIVILVGVATARRLVANGRVA